jgi:TIR domain
MMQKALSAVTTEVHESVPADSLDEFLRELRATAAVSGIERIEQHKNADGTFRIIVFKGTAYDLFISYATEDFDLCVSDFVKSLWRHGVTPVWFDRMSIDVGDSIPRTIDNGLRLSQYMLCGMTERYFNKFRTREELDAIRMQKKKVIPIWVDTNFNAVNAFSPALAAKKAIIYDGDADHAMSVVARILLEDTSTIFHSNKSLRAEK